ncbi:hypothetical protein [Nitrosospira sp. Nsp1]|uniref:hypothetical protein n=1 Tax=Nitrosospira sp. Nsp1 TaxID=136547 RepID=UPI000889A214|nr:hypothetical protein [Nitrosospira sp. Nsp1]SCX40464.1 phage tail tape measure protein, lambda family [Nitrosospira sp. Nsp1]
MSDKKNIDVDITADTSGYRKSADEAKKITQDLQNDFDKAAKEINSKRLAPELSTVAKEADQAGTAVSTMSSRMAIAGRLAATAATVVGSGFVVAGAGALMLAKNVATTADEMAVLSKKTGLSAEDLGAWRLATAQSSTNLEGLAGGLKNIAKYMVEHEDNLRKLGITAKTSEGVLIQLAGVLSSMPDDDPRKMALANEILGKSYQGMMPLLAEGEDNLRKLLERGRELNPVTNEMAKEANYFSGQLAELNLVSSGLGASLASKLLPHLNDILSSMRASARESGILSAIWAGMSGLAAHAFGTDDISKARDRLKEVKSELLQINAFLSGDNATAAHTRALIPRLKELGIEKADLERRLNPVAPETTRRAAPSDGVLKTILNPDRSTRAATGGRSAGKSAGDSAYLDEIKDMAELIKEVSKLTEGEKSHIQVLQDKVNAYSSLDPAVKKYLQDTIDQATQTERLKVFEDASKKLLEENKNLNVGLIESDRERVIAQLELEHQRSTERINGLKIESQQVKALIDQETANYQLRIKETEQELNKTDKLSKRMGLSFSSAFEDAAISGRKFSDVLKGLGDDVARLGLRFMTEKLMGALEGGSIFPGILKGIGGLFGSLGGLGAGVGAGAGTGITSGGLTGFAAKGAWFDGPASYFANGGVFDQPTAFRFADGGAFRSGIMGEAGPEAIMPLRRDASGRLGVAANASAAKPVTVNYAPTIQVDARTDRAEVYAIVSKAVRQGNADLVDKLSRQGMI